MSTRVAFILPEVSGSLLSLGVVFSSGVHFVPITVAVIRVTFDPSNVTTGTETTTFGDTIGMVLTGNSNILGF